jgi:uncharacterized protein HemX
MYTPHPALPPLVAPAAEAQPETQTAGPSLNTIVALVALVATLAAIGWGVTQWLSAKDWRSRSQKIEAQFEQLDARTEKAEAALTTAQRATVQTRKQLRVTERNLATAANQVAFTKDLREEICEAFPELPSDMRERLCS